MRDCLTRNPNERREPAGPVARTKRADANFGPRDFPRRSTGRGSRTRTESRHELGERASGEAGERGGGRGGGAAQFNYRVKRSER